MVLITLNTPIIGPDGARYFGAYGTPIEKTTTTLKFETVVVNLSKIEYVLLVDKEPSGIRGALLCLDKN